MQSRSSSSLTSLRSRAKPLARPTRGRTRVLGALGICVAALFWSCGGAESVDTRSVVLITLDTTRCDALRAFGGQRDVAPNLDALADESVRYVEARTVAPLTLPAHASMMTGLYPPRHGARGNGPAMVPAEAVLLAERAAVAGFQTAGFVGGLTLDRAYGIAQGFEAWTQPETSENRVLGQISDRPAESVVLDALSWLKARDRSRPFFLWVHVFDPHAPYVAPRAFVERANGDAYFGEIARMDAALGDLTAALREDGFLDRGMVCVVADHGEALGEHREDTHGLHVWDSTLRVPFFVRHPRAERARDVRDDTVSVVDVAPTLMDAMGIRIPPDLDGVSLLRGATPAQRGVYFEALSGWERFRWSPMCGWIDRHAKYVHSSKPRVTRPRVDPSEAAAVDDEEFAARARAEIRAVLSKPNLDTDRLAATSGRAIASLGYGDGGDFEPEYPDPLAPSDSPSPDERIDEYRGFVAAQSLNQTGKHAEAALRLEAILRENPESLHALDELGSALVATESWTRAVEVLTERARRPPDRFATHQRLVVCFTALGEKDLARKHTLRALELKILAHERRGETAEALRYRRIYEEETGR